MSSTPIVTASPTPTPTPTSTPTTPVATLIPAETFRTAEYTRSDGPVYHSVIPAWQTGASGKGITIAIIDTGIDTTNPEFAGRIATASRDIVSNRGMAGSDYHGNQVALTAAAARDNSGIMGIAYESTVLMYRADDVGSCGTTNGCSFSDGTIATGIDLAVANGAKVINLSLGGDGADARLTRAIANASLSGVVVVISAGNGGAGEPTSFASLLRKAGGGNVIIAGSVNGQGTLSGFSNKAGAEAQWYLTALGEQVCCVYADGQIKTTTDSSGQTFVTVVSGTSFAAPQIAGAAALLRQAFPSLTAQQVVDLLLSSAVDGGTAGTDSSYGRGILNIASAFTAKGTTTVAGTTTALVSTDSSVITSAAMGDALRPAGTALQATVLDSYQRAYSLNLGNMARRSAVVPRLGSALLGQGRPLAFNTGPVALSISTARFGGALPWTGPLRLSRDEGEAARVLAGRVFARIAPGMEAAIGLSAGADGLAAGLRGAPQPAFLVASGAADDVGFVRGNVMSSALRLARGRAGLTLSGESSRVMAERNPATGLALGPRDEPRVSRFGAALDRRFGALVTSLSANWMAEDRSILGARLAPALGGHGADSLFVDLGAAWQPDARWSLSGTYRRGTTRARARGALAGGSQLASSAWNLDLVRHGLLTRHDSLALRLAQPLRVEGGGLNLRLPTGWDYDSRSAIITDQRMSLAPSGREIDAELGWSGPLAGGTAGATLFWRREPGHIRGLADEQGAAVRWTIGF